ncbi:MAG: Dam family site-specific DNA-(adenine-N6)-methyltransferase, partial [Candidatus Izemoplasmatales bacterium]
GAVLFALQPKKAIINDYNEELINVYKIIKDNPDELIKILQIHKENNNSEYFYKIREIDRSSDYINLNNIERAARIIYLNKTCYNGLYRVNQAGQFNSPFGKYKNPNIVNSPTVKAMHDYFNNSNITVTSGDYKETLQKIRAKTKSFVYLDPPYFPLSSSSSFTGYTDNGFGEKQQIELKNECDKLNKKEIKFLLSNSSCSFIEDLYKQDYNIKIIKAKRVLNSDGNKRGEIDEVLISNYDIL